jgi:hypothetical protein
VYSRFAALSLRGTTGLMRGWPVGIGDASRHQATTEPQYQPCLQARPSRAAAIRMHSAK